MVFYNTIFHDKSIKSDRNQWKFSIFALGSCYTGLYIFYHSFLYICCVSQIHPHKWVYAKNWKVKEKKDEDWEADQEQKVGPKGRGRIEFFLKAEIKLICSKVFWSSNLHSPQWIQINEHTRISLNTNRNGVSTSKDTKWYFFLSSLKKYNLPSYFHLPQIKSMMLNN